MTAHQYDQQCNQVICSARGEHVYVSNGPDANLYGLEPNFGCCTANMHQGWPKFASHLWMKTPDGGLAASRMPRVSGRDADPGKPVKVEVETDPRIRSAMRAVTIVIKVHSPVKLRFPLHLRIPGWA